MTDTKSFAAGTSDLPARGRNCPALMDAPCLDIEQYESGRPSAEACRDGDIRFARFVAKADE
ncbi:MAG: hypothetical protein ACLRRK_00805 [Parasutterella sp.]